jgi:hypothetical protein
MMYEDLKHYTGGIYRLQINSEVLTGHSMRLVGWGHDIEEEGQLYWIA